MVAALQFVMLSSSTSIQTQNCLAEQRERKILVSSTRGIIGSDYDT